MNNPKNLYVVMGVAALVVIILASTIALQPGEATPTPSTTPSESITPSPTSLTPTATITITTPTLTDTPTPTWTPSPGDTLTSTPTLAPTSTPTPTDTPTPTWTPTPGDTLTSIVTQTSTPTLALTPTPTNMPEPTSPPAIIDPPSRPASVVYVQSDGLHRLQPLGLFQQYGVAPAFSPDGRYLAFFGQQGINLLEGDFVKDAGIWVIDLQQSEVWQVIPVDKVKNIAWSPRGDKLAFEVVNEAGAPSVWIVDPIRQDYPRDSGEITRFPGEQPAWRADGQRLVIKDCRGECGLWWVNLDGGGQERLITDNDYGLSADRISYPTLAWNRPLLAFTYQEADGSFDIYQLNLNSGQLQNMTNRPASDTVPVYSRDSSTIYFFTDQYGGGPHWRINAVSSATGTDRNGFNERTTVEGVGPPGEWGLYRPAIR